MERIPSANASYDRGAPSTVTKEAGETDDRDITAPLNPLVRASRARTAFGGGQFPWEWSPWARATIRDASKPKCRMSFSGFRRTVSGLIPGLIIIKPEAKIPTSVQCLFAWT